MILAIRQICWKAARNRGLHGLANITVIIWIFSKLLLLFLRDYNMNELVTGMFQGKR